MSVDPATTSITLITGPIRDVIVVCGGWCGVLGIRGEGAQLQPGQRTGNTVLLSMIERLRLLPGHELKVLGLVGSVVSPAETTRPALEFIHRNFDPRGKLMVYGFSAGGLNAMNVCRSLPSYFNCAQSRLVSTENGPVAPTMTVRSSPAPRNPRAVIDCLFTIDAAAGIVLRSGSSVNRVIPENVRLNVNFYQTSSGPTFSTHSYGGRNTAADPRRTILDQRDLTGRVSHDRMDDETNVAVVSRMQQILES